MKIKSCRNCRKSNLIDLFSLGKISFTGKFAKNKKINIKKTPLDLTMCSKCKLVQLKHNYNLKYLYGPDYGYRTGINKTMSEHVERVTKILEKKANLKSGDSVLDIASNDGTLLNYYKKKYYTCGIDPLVKKYKKNYKSINIKISSFFSKSKIQRKTKKKFKAISALAVFYDLENPNQFLYEVEKILDNNGVILIEFADMLSMIKFNMFDAICHEHLMYLSSKIMIKMAQNNKLRVFDIRYNNINGGSAQYFICKNTSKFKNNKKNLISALRREKKFGIEKKDTYKKFFNKIEDIKYKLKKTINLIKKRNQIIHAYGASTKGNVLLQYFGIGKKEIDFVADRNPKKNNHYTPGTKIKIISEKKSRKILPNFYLVLPWHFRKEILIREKSLIKKGSKFIFPLPKVKIYK
ncbi:MAG: methyltransferase [Candidatus Marinimicrobia bacterium]|nr:methyltransferase [Candidatus Neomarinimicrobiota bacterium]|tara:strand:- start:14740 stop:15963 length:1224 start_codon:yes stop_codon:yes gene_type:complete